MEIETTGSEFPNGGKGIVEQILASEEINKSKREGLQESQSGMREGSHLRFPHRILRVQQVDQLH